MKSVVYEMANDILKLVLLGIMPYLSPIVLLIGATIVSRALGDTIAAAFGASGGKKGRY